MDLSEGLRAMEPYPAGEASASRSPRALPRYGRRDETSSGDRQDAGDQTAVNNLIQRIQDEDDQRALAALMAEFDWIAEKSARRMYRRGESIEDLEQVAREALLGAVARFDRDRGIPFEAFAWTTALGVLRHHYRSRWQLRVPRRLQELHLASMQAIQDLSAKNGRSPTVDELADHLRADREDVILALDAGHAYRAGTLDESSRYQHGGFVPQERTLSALDEALEATADRVEVRELLSSLPLRHRQILVMRFFEGRTQTEIGQALGVSQVHVSRLIRVALGMLRDRAGAAQLEVHPPSSTR
jgi:RNA polymerase sigma-B factor